MRTVLLTFSLRTVALSTLALGACARETPTASTAPSPSPASTQAEATAGGAAAPNAPGSAAGGQPAGETSAATIAVGKPAPDFDVKASDGTKLSAATLKGKPVVVYFYPKDETPGCTKEACAFRDAWNDLGKVNVVLVGVSADSDESHNKFKEHHKLPFKLVSDPDGALANKFGVPPFGRQSFVIGADGNIKKVYRTVNVAEHAREILADVRGG